jgi:AcrR family transcriptional regulator
MPPIAAPVPSRRDRRRLEIFERILGAAESLFNEQGYDTTKVASICEAADVAYGTFFNHFPAKQDLLRALADRYVQRVGERLEEVSKCPGTIEDLLVELFEGDALQIETVTEHHRDIVGRVQSIAFTDMPEDRDRRFHAAFEIFLRRCRDDGRLRRDVPVEVLVDVVASTYSAMSLSWVHFDDYPVRERAAATARFLAESLSPARNTKRETQ